LPAEGRGIGNSLPAGRQGNREQGIGRKIQKGMWVFTGLEGTSESIFENAKN
jgi:hypothetical protein